MINNSAMGAMAPCCPRAWAAADASLPTSPPPQQPAGAGDLEDAALKEGEYVAVRRFVRLLERGGDAKVVPPRGPSPPSLWEIPYKTCPRACWADTSSPLLA